MNAEHEQGLELLQDNVKEYRTRFNVLVPDTSLVTGNVIQAGAEMNTPRQAVIGASLTTRLLYSMQRDD